MSEQTGGSDDVARELLSKGRELSGGGRHDEAFVVWDEVVVRFGESAEPELRECVARALRLKANRLRALGRYVEAIDVLEGLDARFGGAEESAAVLSLVARGLLVRGLSFDKLARHTEEIETYDALVERYGFSDDPDVRECVANALYYKAITLKDLGRDEDALASYGDLDTRFGGSDEPAEVMSTVARGLSRRAFIFDRLGRPVEEMDTYDALVTRYGDSENPVVRKKVADALYFKAITLAGLKRDDDAVAACEELDRRFGGPGEPVEVTATVIKGLGKAARILKATGRQEEILDMWTGVVERTMSEGASDGSLLGAIARVGQANALRALGRNDDAIAMCDLLIDHYGADTRDELRAAVVEGLWVKSRAAAAEDRSELTAATIDELLTRSVDLSDPSDSSEVNGALLIKIAISLSEGHTDVALASSKRLRSHLERATSPKALALYGDQLLKTAAVLRAIAVLGRSHGSTLEARHVPPPPVRELLVVYGLLVQRDSRVHRRALLDESLRIDELLTDGLRDSRDPKARQLVAKAQIQSVETLIFLGRFRTVSRVLDDLSGGGRPVADALQAISDGIDRDTANERGQAANSLMIRVWALSKLKNPADTQAAVDEMTAQFGNDPSVRVRAAVWMARNVMAKSERSWRSLLKLGR